MTKSKRKKKAAVDPEANGHVGTVAEAVDQVVEKAEVVADEPVLVPAPDSPERLAQWDQETIVLINRSEKECSALKREYEDKAEIAKDAKKKYESATADHWDLIRDRRNGRGQPVQGTLFDKTHGHAAAQADLREPGEVPPHEDMSWKTVPMTELVALDGLPEKVAQILADSGIRTLGDLTHYQEPEPSGYTKRLVDLKGIGPAKVGAIDAATESFWKRWKPHATEARAGGATPPVGGDQPGDQPGVPAGGGAAGGAEPEHADRGEGPGAGPGGYRTEESERIANRMREGQARGRKREAKS